MVLVGEGNKLGGYENIRLSSGHKYRLFVRAYVRQGSKYVNSTSSLTQPVTLPLLSTTFDPNLQKVEGCVYNVGNPILEHHCHILN